MGLVIEAAHRFGSARAGQCAPTHAADLPSADLYDGLFGVRCACGAEVRMTRLRCLAQRKRLLPMQHQRRIVCYACEQSREAQAASAERPGWPTTLVE